MEDLDIVPDSGQVPHGVNRPSSPRLFAFDGIDHRLELLPLATRRILDGLGIHLGRAAHAALPHGQRRELALAGSCEPPDFRRALELLESAPSEVPRTDATPEPSSEDVPELVSQALTAEQPLTPKVWQALSGLERYALYKVCTKGRTERIDAAYDEIVGQRRASTHLRPQGGVVMVSVADKPDTQRRAKAECWLSMSPEAFERIRVGGGPKRDILATARLAGIMGTKKTADLIPLCHPLQLLHAEVDFELDQAGSRLRVTCTTVVVARTGVEMEALCGAQIAALTIYDMLKSVDRGMVLGPSRLLEKSGGRSGDFAAQQLEPRS